MKKYILILTAIAVLVSCGKDMGSPSGGLPMCLDAGLTATKASLTTADLQEFWLQVDCPSDASYSFFGKVSRSGTAWSAGRQLWWRDETTPVNYTAAFFSGHDFTGAEFTGGVDLAVPSDQSTQALLNAADLLTLKATSTSYESTAGGTLPVELEHALTKVNFELTLGASFYDNFIGIAGNPVTAFTVSGTKTVFRFFPLEGFCLVGDTEADITPFASEYTPGTAVSAERAKAIFEAVLVPQDIAAGQMKVSFRIGTVEYEWSNATALTLPAGQTVTLPLSATAVPTVNGYAYVDMGLSVKWATMNVGATKATEYGDYFAWGETEPKPMPLSWYDWSSYVFNQGTDWSGPFSKYVTDDSYGTADNKTSLDPEDDAAHVKWGGTWRMPTEAEWAELVNNCNFVKTEHGLSYGVLFTSKKNGNSIFLPLGGYWDGASWTGFGRYGAFYYWSSSLVTDKPLRAWSFRYYDNIKIADIYRNRGHSVRPVTE